MEQERKYSVYVGGIEVHDYLLTKNEACDLRNKYIKNGYSDVKII